MLDFNSLRSNIVPQIEPQKLFTTLTERVEKFKRPHDEQGDILSNWFSKREQKDLVIKMNIKVIFVSILFFMVIGFYFILNEKNILIIVLISINFLIPIHVIIKFIEDIRIKRDYYFLNEEKLIVEIEKEKNT